MFERAATDTSERAALILRLKRARSFLWRGFWIVVGSLIALTIYVFLQVLPILRGDYASFDDSLPTDLIIPCAGLMLVLGILFLTGSVDADHRVKMLILFDKRELDQGQRLAEQNAAEQPATRLQPNPK